MFLKPFRVKSNTTCKSSERKRLKGRISLCFPSLSQAVIDELLPSKCVLVSVRVFTHSNSNVIIFTVNGQPLFFEHEGLLCPTVYTLWNFPDLLPSATTWPHVIAKLQGGADLMLPGIILPKQEVNEEPSLSGVEKGQLCSVNVVENRASLGVGIALMSYDAIVANHWRGKGLKMLHLCGDRLWELGNKTDPPLLKPQAIGKPTLGALDECSDLLVSPYVEQDELDLRKEKNDTSASEHPIEECVDERVLTTELSSNVKPKEDITDTKNDVVFMSSSLEAAAPLEDDINGDIPSKKESALSFTEGSVEESTESRSELSDQISQDWYSRSELSDQIPGDSKVHSNESSTESTPVTPSMDDLLCECFYMAIKTSINKDDLPVLTSTFYRSYIMPLCPPEFNLDIKKSKHKKLSKFLSAMQDEGVLKINEAAKGVETITEIDFKHSKVKKMVPKYIPMKVKTVGECSSASAACTTSEVTQMTITEMYIPTRQVLPVFIHYGYSTASMMTLSSVREAVTRYIREQELVSPSNSSMVVLDPILTDVILCKGEPAPTQLSWHQIITRVLDKMRPGYSIQRGDDPPTYRRMKLEPVRLNVTTRTGNKRVTLVDNLEYFDISAVDIAHQVQRIAAASATVNEQVGKPSRKQVLVQGNNAKVIARLLQEKHGLPLKFIEAVDKTKIPKTQKRHGGKR